MPALLGIDNDFARRSEAESPHELARDIAQITANALAFAACAYDFDAASDEEGNLQGKLEV